MQKSGQMYPHFYILIWKREISQDFLLILGLNVPEKKMHKLGANVSPFSYYCLKKGIEWSLDIFMKVVKITLKSW